MPTPKKPSQVDDRSTYQTASGRTVAGGDQGLQGKGRNGGLANTAPAGFELVARISPNAGWLPYISIAFHLSTAIGLYVLLLDQVQSDDQANAVLGPDGQPLFRIVNNGDPGLVTLGPTGAVGSTIVFSESETEAQTRIRRLKNYDNCDEETRDVAGFPFDRGCIAVLSTTPGLLTQLPPIIDAPPVGGARFTARWQSVRQGQG